MPLGLTARVRHLQNHGKEVTHIAKRHRAAINLAGVHHEQVQRGDELAAVGLLQPSRLMSAELAVLPSASKPIRDRTRVKLHLGTAEFTAMVRLLRREPLEPGTSSLVQLYVSRPAATVWGEAFVIRQESPAETIGGGRILNPTARPLKRPTEAVLGFLASLAGEDELQRLAAAIYFAEWFEGTPNEWARLCGGAPRPEWLEQLVRQQVIDRVDVSGEHAGYVHRRSTQQLADRIVHWLSKLHQRNPLQRTYPYQQLVQTFENRKSSAAAVRFAVDLLVRESRVELAEQRIALAGVGPQLSKAQRQLYDQLAERLRSAGLAVPTVKELVLEHPRMGKSIAPLLNLLVESRVLVRLNADLLIHVDTFEAVLAQLREAFRRKPHMTLAEMRETLQTTRKYAVPLAEYLDSAGITRRVGDHRAWAQHI